jgi:tetratricopeptide (TPR) repeat protein
MGVRKTTVIGVAALFVLLQSLAFADQITDRARLLLQQKNPQAAYRLLEPLESQRAGDPEYDYLLGIAALDSGERERAVFALERVLAVNPNHAQARAEIARAYFLLGEKENALREFQNVRATNPPEAVRQTIDRYLSALGVGPTQLSGFVEIGFGWDSNVNSATASNQIAIPALGGIVATIAPSGVKIHDTFTTAGGGMSVVHGFTPEWAVVAGAAVNGKFNTHQSDFSTGTVDGNLGLRWSRGKEAISAGYQGQDFRVDNDSFRISNGVVGQWQHSYSEYSQVSLFVQEANLAYPGQSIRDARRTIVGVAFGYGWDTPSKPVVFGSLYGGNEKDKDAGFQYLGHKPVGVRFGGQASVTDRSVLFGLLSYERRVYGGDNPNFLVTRRDNQVDLRLGMNYVLSPSWLLVPQVAYTDNRSNTELNKYNRTVISLTLRKTF